MVELLIGGMAIQLFLTVTPSLSCLQLTAVSIDYIIQISSMFSLYSDSFRNLISSGRGDAKTSQKLRPLG